jgi:hypothetical protein
MPLFESPLDPMLGPWAGLAGHSGPSSDELNAFYEYQLSWTPSPGSEWDMSGIVTSVVLEWV